MNQGRMIGEVTLIVYASSEEFETVLCGRVAEGTHG